MVVESTWWPAAFARKVYSGIATVWVAWVHYGGVAAFEDRKHFTVRSYRTEWTYGCHVRTGGHRGGGERGGHRGWNDVIIGGAMLESVALCTLCSYQSGGRGEERRTSFTLRLLRQPLCFFLSFFLPLFFLWSFVFLRHKQCHAVGGSCHMLCASSHAVMVLVYVPVVLVFALCCVWFTAPLVWHVRSSAQEFFVLDRGRRRQFCIRACSVCGSSDRVPCSVPRSSCDGQNRGDDG